MDAITDIEGVLLTPLKIIPSEKGSVMHAMKGSDVGFSGFGEAYFSTVNVGAVKAWKKHSEMTLNVVVPVGEIRFVIYDDRLESKSYGFIREVVLSQKNYCRLTVPPNVWMGFQGVGMGENMLINLANIPHKPEEAINIDQFDSTIPFSWQL